MLSAVDAGEHLKGRGCTKNGQRERFLSQVIPFTEQKKKNISYMRSSFGVNKFCVPRAFNIDRSQLWKVKTSSILMLFLLIIHHLFLRVLKVKIIDV